MKKQVLILISFIVAIIGFLFLTNNSSSSSATLFEVENSFVGTEEDEYEEDVDFDWVDETEFEQSLQERVFVDVQGEVTKPGVFEVDADVRIGYLINLAGGLTDYANVRGLNQAARIYDEMIIFVPHVDDVSAVSEIETQFSNSSEGDLGLISLSTASAAELQTLPRIGATISTNIIAHRDTHGPFSTVDELINVAGVGVGIIENVREFVKP